MPYNIGMSQHSTDVSPGLSLTLAIFNSTLYKRKTYAIIVFPSSHTVFTKHIWLWYTQALNR
jgi:hypothetical protein